jgi:hypothetical protein
VTKLPLRFSSSWLRRRPPTRVNNDRGRRGTNHHAQESARLHSCARPDATQGDRVGGGGAWGGREVLDDFIGSSVAWCPNNYPKEASSAILGPLEVVGCLPQLRRDPRLLICSLMINHASNPQSKLEKFELQSHLSLSSDSANFSTDFRPGSAGSTQ